MKKFHLFFILIWAFNLFAQDQIRLVKNGKGFEVLDIWCPQTSEYQRFYRNTHKFSASVSMEKIAENTDFSVEQLREWGFVRRQNGLWRGELTPLQELWRPLPNKPLNAVFYHSGEPVSENGYNHSTPPVYPDWEKDFLPVWKQQNRPDTLDQIHFGEVLEWMAFKGDKGYTVFSNCYCLYFQKGGGWSLIDSLPAQSWSSSKFGVMEACGNTYARYQKPEQEVVELPPPVIEKPSITKKPTPAKFEESPSGKKPFVEAAVWGGYSELAMKSNSGSRVASKLWLFGQESSLAYAEDRTTFLWLNSICEYWEEDQLNEGLSPNWKKTTGFQWFLGPQARFYHGGDGVLKLGITAGQRYAYGLTWKFLLRPRINYEKYSIIGKLGFQTEADAVFSIEGPQEELYFGNAGVFYAPSFGKKLWLGLEYTNVTAGNGGYASSGTFAMAKWEGAFNLDWLTLIGKYRLEQANVHTWKPSNPSQTILLDEYEGIRWGFFAAITLKR